MGLASNPGVRGEGARFEVRSKTWLGFRVSGLAHGPAPEGLLDGLGIDLDPPDRLRRWKLSHLSI